MVKSRKINLFIVLMLIMTIFSPLVFLQKNDNKDVFANEVFDVWDGTFFTDITNDYSLIFDEGDGSQLNPFLIKTAKQFASLHNIILQDDLKQIYNNENIYYKLTTNLDFNNLSFLPMGSIGLNNYRSFSANLEGSCFTVKNITIDFDSNKNLIGLFACCDNAKISNLAVDNFNYNYNGLLQFVDQPSLGVICAISRNKTVIKNCIANSGNITIKGNEYSDHTNIGGIVGYAIQSEITSSTNNINIQTATKGKIVTCGGIVGLASSTEIKNCVNNGSISNANVNVASDGTNFIHRFGGIVGETSNPVTITCCANNGDINCSTNEGFSKQFIIGGLVGYNNDTTNRLVITDSYSSCNLLVSYPGCINETEVNKSFIVGGLIGNSGNQSTSNYTNLLTNVFAYNNIDILSGQSLMVGNIIGKNISSYINSGVKFLATTTNTCGISSVIFQNAVELSVQQFKEQSNFVEYNFDNIWHYQVNANHPTHKNIGFVNTITYQIQFYIDGQLQDDLTQDVQYNHTAQMPQITIPQGKQFDGWYLASNCTGDKFDFSTQIKQSYNLYGKYDAILCAVNYYVPDNISQNTYVLHSTSQFEYGNQITVPSYAITGYTVNGWYDVDDVNKVVIDITNYVLEKQILNLYLSYTVNNYTITFNATYGQFTDLSTQKTLTQPFNTVVVAIEQPIRDNYQFDGWYTEPNCNDDDFQGDVYVFTTMPASNFTLYARWVKDKVQLLVHAYTETSSGIFAHSTTGGSLGFSITCGFKTAQQSVNVNETTTFYAKANRGYQLAGVYTIFEDNEFKGTPLNQNYNEDGYYIINTDLVPEGGLVLYAKFIKITVTVTLRQEGDFELTGEGTYYIGESVTITCAESQFDNYKFYQWVSINDSDQEIFVTDEKTYTFTISKSIVFIAKSKIKLEIIKPSNGKIQSYISDELTTSKYFVKDTQITIKAVANYGYQFVAFKNEFAGNGSEFVLTLTSPKVIEAVFESKLATVTISTNDFEHTSFGNTTNVVGAYFKINDIIVFDIEATPIEDFMFKNWQTNAKGQFNTKLKTQNYVITAADVENGSIYFIAQIIRSKVTTEVVVYGGGMVTVNGTLTSTSYDGKIQYNSDVIVEITPNNMYYFDKILYKNSLQDSFVDITNQVADLIYTTVAEQDIYIEIYFNPELWTDIRIMPKGKGIPSDPYLITCPEELAYISYAINNGINDTNQPYYCSYIKIVNDIDLSGRFWTPIGLEENNKSFNGIFDVNFCTLRGVKLTDVVNDYSYGGLFGFIGSGKIINVTRSVWLYVGLAGTICFGIALVVMIIYLKKRKVKPKKVVVLPDYLINTKK